jgi:thiaminase (transcriptional activator TenA)
MLHDELLEIAAPVLRKVIDHPFWSGLRDGSLPSAALVHFVQQDTGYLLPAYARALARCAALATDDAHAVLFGRSVCGALEAKDQLRKAFRELAPELGIEPPTEQAPIDPATHAHCSFFTAAAATSLPAAIGALLPMAWFNFNVSNNLSAHHEPGSRYAKWIAHYQPREGYQHVVRKFLSTADEIGERCSASERAKLFEHFSISIRYEWAFAECAWRQPSWPV